MDGFPIYFSCFEKMFRSPTYKSKPSVYPPAPRGLSDVHVVSSLVLLPFPCEILEGRRRPGWEKREGLEHMADACRSLETWLLNQGTHTWRLPSGSESLAAPLGTLKTTCN